jgi:hypothetical protein
MAYISFVDDSTYKSIVNSILIDGRNAKLKAMQKFNRNVIDPFSIVWELASFKIDFSTWYQTELTRQAQKTLSNKVGLFHQTFLGGVEGWEDLGVGKGIDLVNPERKIIAEIKNKHNTLKGSSQVDLYEELHSLVMRNGHTYKDYTAYYVEVIPKTAARFNVPFTPSDKKTSSKKPINELIRRIDGASFYALVTGVDDALEQVLLSLPKVIKDTSEELDTESLMKVREYFERAYFPKPKVTKKSQLKKV